jgi:hypothetical protein
MNLVGGTPDFTLIATELKKDESRGGKNCHDKTMMNTQS